mgnify:CR=1 FL=1
MLPCPNAHGGFFMGFVELLLLAVGLSMDAFAVSVTDGLIYRDVNVKKTIFIATLFGFLQGFMPLISYYLVEIINLLVGSTAGSTAGNVLSIIVTWVSFSLLLIIGGKMFVDI